MEVMCLTCKKMFSIDDNIYKGDWKNFCGVDCQNNWLNQKINPDNITEPFVWVLEKSDGK